MTEMMKIAFVAVFIVTFCVFAILEWRRMNRRHKARLAAMEAYFAAMEAADEAYFDSLRYGASGNYEQSRASWQQYLERELKVDRLRDEFYKYF